MSAVLIVYATLPMVVQEEFGKGISVWARLERRSILRGEVLFYEAGLRNDSTNSLNAYVSPNMPGLQISIDGSNFLAYGQPSWLPQALPEPARIEVASGEQQHRLGWGVLGGLRRRHRSEPENDPENKPFFQSVGRYWVRAVITIYPFDRDEPHNLFSDPIEVEVEEPTGVDAEAWEYIRRHEMERMIGTFGRFDVSEPSVEQTVKSFLTQHGSSRYAGYYRLGLGSALINRQKAAGSRRDENEVREGISYLRAAADETDHPQSGNALYFLGEAYRFAGDRAEARRCFEAAAEAKNCHLKEAAEEALKNLPPE